MRAISTASGRIRPKLVEPLWEHTRHYHLEDIPADRTHEHTQLGDGAMDIDAFLGELEDRGYDGFVTVELYPYEETPIETAREAMASPRNAGGRRVAGGVSSDRNENTRVGHGGGGGVERRRGVGRRHGVGHNRRRERNRTRTQPPDDPRRGG